MTLQPVFRNYLSVNIEVYVCKNVQGHHPSSYLIYFFGGIVKKIMHFDSQLLDVYCCHALGHGTEWSPSLLSRLKIKNA